jgi:hypothetical protein
MTIKAVLTKFIVVTIFYNLVIVGPLDMVQADIQKNGLRQKIGDYELQISTTPLNPLNGRITNILISINVSNANLLLTDIPVVLKITKDNEEISMSNPIFVTGGHLNYPYVFKSPGTYGLEIDFLKNSIEGDSQINILTSFEFPLQISDSNQIPFIPLTIGALVTGSGIAFLVIRKNYHIFHRLNKSDNK